MANTATAKARTALAKTKVESLPALINKSVAELGRALPAHMNAERLARIAQTVLRTNPGLYACDPKSVLAALFQCASLGLEPVAGHAWIIPYRVKGVPVAQFQVGAYGWVDLFYRHQSSISLHVETVHANDRFEYDLGTNTLTHRPPGLGEDRGEVKGYYAAARMVNGGFAFKVMSRGEVQEIAERFSKCFVQKEGGNGEFIPGTPWREHFDAMAHKTVLRRLIKTLPKSIEIQRALQMDETVKREIRADMTEVPAENTIQVAQEEAQEAATTTVPTA